MDKITLLAEVSILNAKIKQLEEEFNICEKLLDETREDLYKEQAENQRLREIAKFFHDNCSVMKPSAIRQANIYSEELQALEE